MERNRERFAEQRNIFCFFFFVRVSVLRGKKSCVAVKFNWAANGENWCRGALVLHFSVFMEGECTKKTRLIHFHIEWRLEEAQWV